MRKINLEALESKNMTAAAEDTLSEINGGCTFKIKCSTRCGKKSYYISSAKACSNRCNGGAAIYVASKTGIIGNYTVWSAGTPTRWGVQHKDWNSCRVASNYGGEWHFD